MARPQIPQETQKIIVQLHQDGVPVGAISRRLNCSPGAVRNALARRGIVPRRYSRKALKIAGIPVYAIIKLREDWQNAPDGPSQEAVVKTFRNSYRVGKESTMRAIYGSPPYVLTPEILAMHEASHEAQAKRGMSEEHREDLKALMSALQDAVKGHRGPLADSIREIIETIRETLAKDALEALSE